MSAAFIGGALLPPRWAAEAGLDLERFDWVDDAGALHRDDRPEAATGQHYGCGIYTFRRAT